MAQMADEGRATRAGKAARQLHLLELRQAHIAAKVEALRAAVANEASARVRASCRLAVLARRGLHMSQGAGGLAQQAGHDSQPAQAAEGGRRRAEEEERRSPAAKVARSLPRLALPSPRTSNATAPAAMNSRRRGVSRVLSHGAGQGSI